MISAFYISAIVAVISTVMVITNRNAVHALLYLIVSLLSVALVFFSLGAPFVAALEVIIYAGAIMVLFVFVIMMLNLSSKTACEERRLSDPKLWIGPVMLSLVLLAELILIVTHVKGQLTGSGVIGPKEVGITLLGPYVLGVELASILLLAGLVGAYHIGRRGGGQN